LKGEGNDAPLLGALMLTVPEVLEEPPDVVVPVPDATLMGILATQPAPPLPHDFTCTVCAPAEAVMEAATEVLFTIAVFELLSSE
jgi:hypothetical protein